MPDEDVFGEQFAGLVSLVISLILVLERSGALDPRELAAEVRRAYDDLDAATQQGAMGGLMAEAISFLDPPDPENPPPRPSWFRGVIHGDRKSS